MGSRCSNASGSYGSAIRRRYAAPQLSGDYPVELPTRNSEEPSFPALTDDEAVQGMLRDRWLEAAKCLEAEAHLAAMVMVGSVMEGALLAIANQHLSEVMRAASAPKDRAGKPRRLPEWKLDKLVQVARELNWTPAIMAHFIDVIKTLRNLVHPWEELERQETPDRAVARLCYQTVESLLEQLANHKVARVPNQVR